MANWTWPNGSDTPKTISISVTAERPQKETVDVVPYNALKESNKKIQKIWDTTFSNYPDDKTVYAPQFDGDIVSVSRTIKHKHKPPTVDDIVIVYNSTEVAWGVVTGVGEQTINVKIDWPTYHNDSNI